MKTLQVIDLNWQGDVVKGENVAFRRTGLSKSGRTAVWEVLGAPDDVHIGIVSWYGPWRQYCFFPADRTVFEKVCLAQIAQFCLELTTMHARGGAK